MKLEKKTRSIKTNMESLETFNVGIGNSSKLLELAFQGLYSHKIRTCVQEIVSNAIDSHVLAKKPINTIKITSPTEDHLFFEVKDSGLGMSLDQLKHNIKAGNSGSVKYDETIGGYGLGLKSCLGVADSFLIEIIKDKNKSLVEVKHDPSGVEFAIVDVLFQEKTNEHNGVSIKIPCEIKNIPKFEYGIQRILKHIKEKPNVNLKINNKKILSETDKYCYVKNETKDIYAIVGSVEYTLDQLDVKEQVLNLFPDIELGIKFNLKEIIPMPSRELLENSEKVNKIILKRAKEVKKDLLKQNKDYLNSLNFKDLVSAINHNPFFSIFNKNIKGFQFNITKNGLSSIQKERFQIFPLSFFVSRTWNGDKRVSSASKYFKEKAFYTQFIFNDKEKHSVLRKKISLNCETSKLYNKQSYNSVFCFTEEDLLEPEIIKFLDIKKSSDLNYNVEKKKGKKKIQGEFTFTDSNHRIGRFESLPKKTYFIPFSVFSKFNRESIESSLELYAKHKKIFYYVISKETQKEFEKLGFSELKIKDVKDFFTKKDSERKNALYKLKRNHPLRYVIDCPKKFLPKNLRINFPKTSDYRHAFYRKSIEEKIYKEYEKEMKSFIKKHALFHKLLSHNIIKEYENDKHIKLIIKDHLNEI